MTHKWSRFRSSIISFILWIITSIRNVVRFWFCIIYILIFCIWKYIIDIELWLLFPIFSLIIYWINCFRSFRVLSMILRRIVWLVLRCSILTLWTRRITLLRSLLWWLPTFVIFWARGRVIGCLSWYCFTFLFFIFKPFFPLFSS